MSDKDCVDCHYRSVSVREEPCYSCNHEDRWRQEGTGPDPRDVQLASPRAEVERLKTEEAATTTQRIATVQALADAVEYVRGENTTLRSSLASAQEQLRARDAQAAELGRARDEAARERDEAKAARDAAQNNARSLFVHKEDLQARAIADTRRIEDLEGQVATALTDLGAALLKPSEPGSSWKGINAECKGWQERALAAESALATTQAGAAEMRLLLQDAIPTGDRWWCPTCKRTVDDTDVSFDERHDGCGTSLHDVNAGDWVEAAKAALSSDAGRALLERMARLERIEAAAQAWAATPGAGRHQQIRTRTWGDSRCARRRQ